MGSTDEPQVHVAEENRRALAGHGARPTKPQRVSGRTDPRRKVPRVVDLPVVDIIRRYLSVLPAEGIHPTRAILFGSFATGKATQDSDIDLIVIAPEFDDLRDRRLIRRLWIARAQADTRIEPIPCGEKEWQTDSARPILEIARQGGVDIPVAVVD